MNRYLIQLVIFLLFLMLPFVAVGLFCLKGRGDRSASAPRTNKIVGIAEVIILFSAGIVSMIGFACVEPGVLLHLGQMRSSYAATHIVVTIIAGALFLIAAFMLWKGRTSWSVILLAFVIFFYFSTIKPAPLSGPSYLMSKIAPKDSGAPVVNYTFEVNNSLEEAEVWINGVFLGTTPLEMTGREFHKKVPFLTEPPEGFQEEGIKRPKGDWFRFSFLVLKKKENFSNTGISYNTEFEDYYAKIKYADEWGKNCMGSSGGGGDFYQHDYDVSLSGHFSITDKLKQEKNERFNKLIQKARLADYHVNKEWFETIDTYGDRGLSEIQELAKNEKKFSVILDKWVKWKYGISDSMTQKQAGKVFEDICRKIDKQRFYSSDSFEGRVAELVYDKLNVGELIKRYVKLIKARPSGHSPMSNHVVSWALKSWDTKLNAENSNTLNIIEKKLVPALIINDAVDSAIPFGGPDIDRFLIRQYRRNPIIEGNKLGQGNYESTMGVQLNKWLYNLAFEKSSSAEKFRVQNKQEIMELAELMVNNNFNNERKPPEFLFYDLNLGQESMAYEYWPDYSVHVESSFPPCWYDKLKKRWEYLNRLGSLATEEMYVHCWKIADFKSELMGGYLKQALLVLPQDKKVPVTKVIIKDILTVADKKRQEIGLDINAVHYFQEDACVDVAREFLAKSGDRESLQWLLSKYEIQKKYIIGRLKEIIQYESTPEFPLIGILAMHEDIALRHLSLEAIRRFPTPTNRAILDKLLSDSDEEVRNASKIVEAELEEIKNMPFSELVSEPKGN